MVPLAYLHHQSVHLEQTQSQQTTSLKSWLSYLEIDLLLRSFYPSGPQRHTIPSESNSKARSTDSQSCSALHI